MKDITESARVAAHETVGIFRNLGGLLLFTVFLCIVGGALVGSAFFVLRWLVPQLSVHNAIAIAVMAMILPIAAIGWFGIVFSVELEKRRKHRD